MIDRQRFYDHIRSHPFSGLTGTQVAGISAILDTWGQPKVSLDDLAGCLATSFHDTAGAMQPVGGKDRAEKIAVYADVFLKALTLATEAEP